MRPVQEGGKDAVAHCEGGRGCHGVGVAADCRVASDCCEAAEHGWVVLCGVKCPDCREGGSGDSWEGCADGVAEVGFARVGEYGILICGLSVGRGGGRGKGGGVEDFVNVELGKDSNVFEEAAL